MTFQIRSKKYDTDGGAVKSCTEAEWWYATGWPALPDGRPLGFQVTFFRVRTGVGEGSPSAFAPRQLVMAHAAIADPQLGRLRHDERSARVGFGRAGFEIGRTAVNAATGAALDGGRYRAGCARRISPARWI